MTALTLETYTFSLSRSTGKMRFRLEDQDILVDRLVGQWWAKGCNRDGSIVAECALDVRQDERGTVAYLFHPDIEEIEVPESPEACSFEPDNAHDHCHVATGKEFPQGHETHWRLCYAREIAMNNPDQPYWRLRDERTDDLWFVRGYTGPMNINWFDHGTHIFCDGPCWVDEDMVAHFG